MIEELVNRAGYYFNLMPDKEDEREIVEQISCGVSFRGASSGYSSLPSS